MLPLLSWARQGNSGVRVSRGYWEDGGPRPCLDLPACAEGNGRPFDLFLFFFLPIATASSSSASFAAPTIYMHGGDDSRFELDQSDAHSLGGKAGIIT